jgi:hypothetical protein
VKEMLKEMQEVKVGGRTQRVQVRPFAWNARMLLTLPAFVVLFIARLRAGSGDRYLLPRLRRGPVSGGSSPLGSAIRKRRVEFPWI